MFATLLIQDKPGNPVWCIAYAGLEAGSGGSLCFAVKQGVYMNALTKIATAFLASVTLYGCAGQSRQLVSEDEPKRAVGSITHGGVSDPTLSLEFGGKRFEARGFAINRSQNLARLREQYGFGSKHYDRVSTGTDPEHYRYSAKPELRAEDGTTMQCVLAWRAYAAPAGVCVSPDGKEVKFRAE